jgi:hypothetical protein
MVVVRTENGVFHAKLTKDELIIVNNCLNEVCNGRDLFEFETRIGASKEEAHQILDRISTALRGS